MILRISKGNVKNSIKVALLFFFFVHPFLLKISPTISYGIIYGVPLLYLFMKYGYLVKIVSSLFKSQGRFYLGMYFLLILATIVMVLIHQTNDYSYFSVLRSVLFSLLKFLFLAIVILRNSKNRENCVEDFMHYYIIADVIYVSFSMLLILFPSLKNLWFGIISQNSLYLTEQELYTYRIGINGFAGFRETFACTMGVTFALYLIEKSSQRKKIQYVIMIIMCLIGNFLYGRSGLALSGAILIFYIMYYRKMKIRDLVFILGVILLLIGIIRAILNANPHFIESINWALRPFIDLFTTGHTNNHSFNNILYDMRFMPELSVLLFGSGYYTDPITGAYYMNTDLGFMRIVLFFGVSGLIIIYSMMLFAIKDIGTKSSFLGISILILFIGFEYKGEIWYSLFPLLLLLFMLNKYKEYWKRVVGDD